MNKVIAIALSMLIVTGNAFARGQITIVGSSIIYPYASFVAEEFGSVSRYPTPVVEATGTEAGIKLFCADNGAASPDIVNASRSMTTREFDVCDRNGVDNITEVTFGYEGIVLAQSSANTNFNLSRKELLLAVAERVPNMDASTLIANPYQYWDEISAQLPHRKIAIYGPPPGVDAREAFEEKVMEYQAQTMQAYRDAGEKTYRSIRADGVYIAVGENDSFMVRQLEKNKDAIGVSGYSYLTENSELIKSVSIDGIKPDTATISTQQYPLARSLFFYVKNDHYATVPALQEYVETLLHEELAGDDGLLQEMGFIPLDKELLETNRQKISTRKKLSREELATRH